MARLGDILVTRGSLRDPEEDLNVKVCFLFIFYCILGLPEGGGHFGVIFATFPNFVVPKWEVRLLTSFWMLFETKNDPSAGCLCC